MLICNEKLTSVTGRKAIGQKGLGSEWKFFLILFQEKV